MKHIASKETLLKKFPYVRDHVSESVLVDCDGYTNHKHGWSSFRFKKGKICYIKLLLLVRESLTPFPESIMSESPNSALNYLLLMGFDAHLISTVRTFDLLHFKTSLYVYKNIPDGWNLKEFEDLKEENEEEEEEDEREEKS